MHIYNDWPWACQSWCIFSSILDGYFSLHISIGMQEFHLFFFFLKTEFFSSNKYLYENFSKIKFQINSTGIDDGTKYEKLSRVEEPTTIA